MRFSEFDMIFNLCFNVLVMFMTLNCCDYCYCYLVVNLVLVTYW